MTIDRDLLWQAWPDGFVPARGIWTVGGWLCVEVVTFDAHPEYSALTRWLPPSKLASNGTTIFTDLPLQIGKHPEVGWAGTPVLFKRILKAREDGDLLPNVNPKDVATWNCLKQELAEAAFGTTRSGRTSDMKIVALTMYPDIQWTRGTDYGVTAWWLRTFWRFPSGQEVGVYRDFKIDTSDPALALVRARIDLRKEAAVAGKELEQ